MTRRRSNPLTRVALATACTLFALATAPALAAAATVSASEATGVVRYDAPAGERNTPIVTGGPSIVRVTDSRPLTPGAGCVEGGSTTSVNCDSDGSQFRTFRADLENGNDTMDARGLSSLETRLDGSDGTDSLIGSPGADILIGGEGADTVNYSERGEAPVTVTVGSGADDGGTSEGQSEGDYVASDVETVIGTSGDDSLTGAGSANSLFGRGGDDRLDGRGGDDILDGQGGGDTVSGGTGLDTVRYNFRTQPVRVTIGTGGTVHPPDPPAPGGFVGDDGESAEGDDIQGDVEVVFGGNANDRLQGDSSSEEFHGGGGDDFMDGNDGSDTLIGDAGADDFFGGDGSGDTADYRARLVRTTVTIGRGADDGASGEGDYVASDIENLTGGTTGDILIGSSAANTFKGNGGADLVYGGAGPDTFQGGETAASGSGDNDSFHYDDEFFYSGHRSGVRADADGVADDGAGGRAEGDNIGLDVEDITGGPGNDVLYGSSQENALFGNGGNDTLDVDSPPASLGPPDALFDGPGADVLRARNGRARDILNCSDAGDRFTADPGDLLGSGCD